MADERSASGLTAFEDAMVLLDILLPGDAQGWPPASRALDGLEAMLALLAPADQDWLIVQARAVAGFPGEHRSAAVQGLAERQPDGFGRVFQALCAAYYSSPAAQVCIEALADRSPREPSPHFDTSLVARVVQTQAGRRRLP